MVRSVAEGPEDGSSLGHVGDGVGHGGEELRVGEVGLLMNDLRRQRG